jgi:Holliday junction resolvasome RuvABC ATP-dependent DNA helicase subunit
LVAPYGMGKTTLARVVANELGVGLRAVQAGALQTAGDCAAILTNLHKGDILLVEDIHWLEERVAEVLAGAMLDCSLGISIGQGPGARCVQLSLPHFTVIGTTDMAALVPRSLARAFPLVFLFQEYSAPELEVIVQQVADQVGLGLDPESRQTIGVLAGGFPRRALQLLHQWSHLTAEQGANLSRAEAVFQLSQLAQDYQTLRDEMGLEQEPTIAYMEKLIHHLESRLEKRLDDLAASLDQLNLHEDDSEQLDRLEACLDRLDDLESGLQQLSHLESTIDRLDRLVDRLTRVDHRQAHLQEIEAEIGSPPPRFPGENMRTVGESAVTPRSKTAQTVTDAKELVKRYQAGERNFSGARLSGADLSGANLTRADLSGSDLSGADMSSANLTKGDLSGADLSGTNFFDAVLVRVNMGRADLTGAMLLDARLSGADLTEANLEGAVIENQQFAQVTSLRGTTMPDGSRHD